MRIIYKTDTAMKLKYKIYNKLFSWIIGRKWFENITQKQVNDYIKRHDLKPLRYMYLYDLYPSIPFYTKEDIP